MTDELRQQHRQEALAKLSKRDGRWLCPNCEHTMEPLPMVRGLFICPNDKEGCGLELYAENILLAWNLQIDRAEAAENAYHAWTGE